MSEQSGSELSKSGNAAVMRFFFDTKGGDLIDRLFLRGLELMLLTLVLCSLAWILLRRFSTRPRVRAERIFHRAA